MIRTNLFSSPCHIAENNVPEFSEEISLNFIVPKQILQILLNNLCADLNYPMTIIQWDTNDNRIDTTLSSICLRPSCENFRRAAGTKHCESSDSSYASIFYGLTKSNLNQKVMERINDPEFISHMIGENGIIPEYIIKDDTGYLKYPCKIMGYIELIFPIIFENNVIGTLFIGQIRIDNNKVYLEFQNKYFQQNPDIFNDYIKKIQGSTDDEHIKEIIKRKIMDNQSKRRDMLPNHLGISEALIGIDPKDEYDVDSFHILTDKVFSTLIQLQQQLDNYMQDKREMFIRNTVDASMKKFYEQRSLDATLSDDSLPPGKVIYNFWNDVTKSMEILVRNLGLQYMIIFGVDTLSISEVTTLNSVSYIPASKNEIINWKNEYSNYRINLSNIHKNLFYKASTSHEHRDLLKCVEGINGRFDADNKLLIFFPVSDKPQYSVVMLISFGKNLDSFFEKLLDSLTKHLISGGTAIFSYLISRLSRLSESSTNRMLRIYRHEISHVTLGLQHILDFRLRDSSYIHQLSDEKIDGIRLDFGSSLSQLRTLSANVEAIMGSPHRIEYEEVKVFKEIIYKWRELYKRQIEHKMLSLLTPSVNDRDELRSPYKTDKYLLDQIIFNLIDNAIKYCYLGTNIHIDCARPTEDSARRSLTITSFGKEMDNNESPYKLFSRGYDSYDNAAGGVGVGLYVVKESAHRLGGDVSHKCIKISAYNIPMMEAYINLPYQIVNKRILANVKNEIQKLKGSSYVQNEVMDIEKLRKIDSVYSDAINNELYDNENKINKLPTKRILEQISYATYKTTFEVNI